MITERILLIAYLHVAKQSHELRPQVWDEVERADVVVGAGEWVDVALLDRRSRRLVCVHGNSDHGELRERLPQVGHEAISGERFAAGHEFGPSKGREQRCASKYSDADVLVFGHSYIPCDTTTETGLRLLNPGLPTCRRYQPHCTYMTAIAEAGELRKVQVHRLPPQKPPR